MVLTLWSARSPDARQRTSIFIERICSIRDRMRLQTHHLIAPLPTEQRKGRESSGYNRAPLQEVEGVEDLRVQSTPRLA